jgi:hypothetical protein
MFLFSQNGIFVGLSRFEAGKLGPHSPLYSWAKQQGRMGQYESTGTLIPFFKDTTNGAVFDASEDDFVIAELKVCGSERRMYTRRGE